ncbi:MAG: FAD-dependent oxidoreductase [Pseudomonadales bacterium]|nr:FAD-dependent oxidoreductase [Pseudomonadales bacterium]
MDKVETIVIGAGVVGLAVAAKLAQSGQEVLVLEQHDLIGSETSSRNSEVIHAGIYYPQDSRKAVLCVRGKKLLYEHCQEFNVPHRQCGKIIVASRSHQIPTVQAYVDKASANGVPDLAWLSAEEVSEMEPEVRTVGGVLSPSTGIIDSHAYMLSLQGILEAAHGMIAFKTVVKELKKTSQGIEVETEDFTLSCDNLINAGGLYAPSLAHKMVDAPDAYYAIGHYYSYAGKQPFSRLVYPTAEPGGLGVHVTLDLAGQVKFGPDVRWIGEINYDFDESHFDNFVQAISAYYPAVDPARLHPGYTGIRPKIAPPEAGFIDFEISGPSTHGVGGLVNLLGIESPGLTASLAIAEQVAAELGISFA